MGLDRKKHKRKKSCMSVTVCIVCLIISKVCCQLSVALILEKSVNLCNDGQQERLFLSVIYDRSPRPRVAMSLTTSPVQWRPLTASAL